MSANILSLTEELFANEPQLRFGWETATTAVNFIFFCLVKQITILMAICVRFFVNDVFFLYYSMTFKNQSSVLQVGIAKQEEYINVNVNWRR